MNEGNAYLFALGAVVLMLTLKFVAMMHEKDVNADCIKSATKQHYTVDDIERLCK